MRTLRLAIYAAACFAAALSGSARADDKLHPDLHYFIPKCDHHGRSIMWCEAEGGPKNNQNEILSGLISPPEGSKLDSLVLSTFAFSSFKMADYLCRQANEGAAVTVFLDYKYWDNPTVAKIRNKCPLVDGRGVNLVPLGGLPYKFGSELSGGILHIKLYIFEYAGADNVEILFGTPNASYAAFGLHLEAISRVLAPKTSNFAKQHQCLKESLAVAGATPRETASEVREAFGKHLGECRRRIGTLPFDEALEKEGIAPVFTLNSDDNYEERIINAIDAVPSGGTIDGVFHLFTTRRHSQAPFRAVKRGVRVRLAMEDDTLTGALDSKLTAKFYRRFLKNSGIQFRFVETNSAINQLLHARFILLNGKLLLHGSGQLSESALTNNYENFYVSTDRRYIGQHKELFDLLWSIGYPDPEPESYLTTASRRALLNFGDFVRSIFGLGTSDSFDEGAGEHE